MTNEMEKKLEALLQNPDEINAIYVGAPDQILKNFAARGIEMTKQELGELSTGLMEGLGLSAEGELSEDDLENVAGGGIGTVIVCAAIIGAAIQIGRGWNDGSSGKASASKCGLYQLGHFCGKNICRGCG